MTADVSWTGGASLLAEVGTCQMEFCSLSHAIGDAKYCNAVQKAWDHLEKMNPAYGLYPIFINPYSGQFTNSHITLGAMGDSFYEYECEYLKK